MQHMSAVPAAVAPIDSTHFRDAMSSFATGVTVVTVGSPDGELHGMTVNAFSSVSLDPTLLLVCLTATSTGLSLIETAGAFSVNVLSSEQENLSRWFANKRRPADSSMFHGVPHVLGTTGCPVLSDAAASFDCLLHQLHRAGDHLIVVGQVVGLTHRPDLEPLVFHAGTYGSVGELAATAGRAPLHIVETPA